MDIYFDTTDEVLAATDDTGAFSKSITIPPNASYETHWITAVGRHSGLAAQQAFLVSANWPMFRRLPVHDGFNPHETALSPATVGGLRLDWSFQTAQSAGSPMVVNGVVYFQTPLPGSAFALDASTGSLLWSYAPGAGGGSPAVANGVVYVRHARTTEALDAATGSLLWSFAARAGTGTPPPTVVDGVVT